MTTGNVTISTSEWILLGITAFLLLFIFLPFSFYYSCKIWRHKDSIIIHKRFPYLILVTVIGNCIYLSTEKTIILLASFDVIPNVERDRELIEFIVYACIHWVFIYALYLSVLRYWLLYFKLEWALSNINNQWQSIINSRMEHRDWFLKNKKKYGSYTWLIKKVMIFTTILALLYTVQQSVLYTVQLNANKYKLPFDLIMGTIIYSPSIFIMFYVIWKLPSFDDYLLIKQEAKFSIIVFLLLTAMNLICAVFDEQSEPDKDVQFFNDIDYYEKMESIVHLVTYNLCLIGFFVLNYKQTRWVLGRFEKVIRRFSSREVKNIAFGNEDESTMNSYHELGSESTRMDSKRHIKLQHIFNHDRAFDLFMNYLYKQHCSEILLSLIEIYQYQQLIYDDLWTTLAIHQLNDDDTSTNSPQISPNFTSSNNNKTLSLKSLGPYNNHNRNGTYKPFEIQINTSPNMASSRIRNDNDHKTLELMTWNTILNGKGASNENEEEKKEKESSLNVVDKQINKMGEQLVVLPQTLPRSSIVYCRFETEDLKLSTEKDIVGKLRKYRNIAYDIYEKYIKIGAEYEINIDYTNRKKYNKLFVNKWKWINGGNNTDGLYKGNDEDILYNAHYLQEAMILFQLYQPCIDQMYRFCSSCFGTFKNTVDFDRLTDLFTIKKNVNNQQL